MIDHLTFDGSCIYVHQAEISLRTTKSFTHGGVVFDRIARTVTFGRLPSVALPERFVPADKAIVEFKLVAPDGSLRKQTRSGVLKSNEKQPDILRIAGFSKTARRFSAEDGWQIIVYKYRAWFTHPGARTDGEIPEWLKQSVARQREFWNRLAGLCRDARRQCSPVPTADVIAFVHNTILPEIDAFNLSLGRDKNKDKLRHPKKLKVEMPGLDSVWKFVGELRHRIEKDRPVPPGLLEKTVAFAEQYKGEYTPINDFLDSINSIIEREAKELGLRSFEVRPIVMNFKAALQRRRSRNLPWSDGWPRIKYPDSPKSDDWGLHYYLNRAGLDSSLLESGHGVPGLTFGPPLKPADTGHETLTGRAANCALREAEISIPGSNHERWNFRFVVLQHRPLPNSSHIKEWKLLYNDGALWLCLIVEFQQLIPTPSGNPAGLDIGWRRTEDGILFGTLYEPASKTFRELTIDLQKSPRDHKDRVPFRIDFGQTRWERRNITSLLPDWKPGNPIPNAFEIRALMASRRDFDKDATKILLRKRLGDQLPAWVGKAGRKGLLKLAEEFKDDEAVRDILFKWMQKDEAIGKLVHMYFDSVAKRLEYGQAQVAHDACKHLQQKRITRLIVETSFLKRISEHHDNDDPVGIKRSQKYRQFAAVGKFIAILKNTAAKYGIVVDAHEALNTTRICQYCNHLNPRADKEQFVCEKCLRHVKQDQNAAVNLSRFGADPELAEMALTIGKA